MTSKAAPPPPPRAQKLPQKPLGEQKSISFDVVKPTPDGKKEPRKLCFAEDGVRTLAGDQVSWYLDADSVLSLKPSKASPTSFKLTATLNFTFEAKDAAQLKAITDGFASFHLNTRGIAKFKEGEGGSGAEEWLTSDTDHDGEAADAGAAGGASSGGPGTFKGSGGLAFRLPPTPTAPDASAKKVAKAPGKAPGAAPSGIVPSSGSSVGVSVKDFELIACIGRGSFGKVLVCRKKSDKRILAMKILSKKHIFDHKQELHTVTERTILATLQHPFMPKFHYAFQSDFKLYVVMDFVNGGELFMHLRRNVRFPFEIARFVIAELVDVFDYLHQNHVVYRDLKPENVLLQKTGHIMLIDFGLAKILRETEYYVGKEKRFSSTTQTYCGTEEYMAPEVMLGKAYGKAVDWWNVGYLFYVLLVGDHPFKGGSQFDAQNRTLKCEFTVPAYVPPVAKDFISQILVADPTKRLGSRYTASAPTSSSAYHDDEQDTCQSTAALCRSYSSAFSAHTDPGAAEIKSHALFAGIDWVKLRKMEIQPPFVPALPKGELDLTYVDEEFTQEPAIDTPPQMPKSGSFFKTKEEEAKWRKSNSLFENFDYSEDLPPAKG